MPAVTVVQPIVAPSLTDGMFSGLAAGPPTSPGNIVGYPSSRNYFGIPPVTALTAAGQRVAPVNKLIIYVNGIGTNRDTHGYTVKLISVITGANVIGIYNQSGDGTSSGALDMVSDLIQCLGDKTGLGNNAATNTLARSVFKACTSAMPINIVAHSQGAIITSRGMRQAIGMLLDFYGRRDPTVRPLLEEVDHILNRSMLATVGRSFVPFSSLMDSAAISRLRTALETRIRPIVEQKLDEFVSAQTFGGAARFYPNGPKYRHVFNVWDPVPLVGQNDIFTGPGRGARVESLDRNSDMFIRDIADHSITDLYLQSSDHYVDRNGHRVDNSYIPIDMSMVR
jgi:hypothetical protein